MDLKIMDAQYLSFAMGRLAERGEIHVVLAGLSISYSKTLGTVTFSLVDNVRACTKAKVKSYPGMWMFFPGEGEPMPGLGVQKLLCEGSAETCAGLQMPNFELENFEFRTGILNFLEPMWKAIFDASTKKSHPVELKSKLAAARDLLEDLLGQNILCGTLRKRSSHPFKPENE